MPKKFVVGLPVIAVLLMAVAVMSGCVGVAGVPPAGTSGATSVVSAAIQPESCLTCHGEVGAKHQASYDELYQDGVIQVADLAYSFSPPDTSTVTFKMSKDGAPFDGTKAEALSIYFTPYTGTKFQFEPAADRLSLLGDPNL